MSEFAFVGRSLAVQRVREQIDRFARVKAPVTVIGETGTGKERAARLIHEISKRPGDFVVVDAHSAEDRFVATLRGYCRGSFTGAIGVTPGAFEEAHRGTLFLDTVDALSLDAQRVLLGILSQQAIRQIGGVEHRSFDVRIVASAQRDLRVLVARGDFRAELYHRLVVLRLDLPNLRSQPVDLVYWIERLCPSKTISEDVLKLLLNWSWPGNLRELRHVLTALALLNCEKTLKASTLGDLLSKQAPWRSDVATAYQSMKQSFQEQELEFLRSLLSQHRGSYSKTARVLKLGRQQLCRRLKSLQKSSLE
jgi:DNA-binding NtrC family response regulator